MGTNLSKIREALNPKYIPQEQSFIKEENKKKNGEPFISILEVDISGVKDYPYFICKLDENDALFPYFSEIKGLHCICDYFLFLETIDSFYIFLIELKSGASPKLQLNVSEILVHFILERIGLVHHKISKNLIIRKIGFTDKSYANKKVTKPKDYQYDKDGYLTIKGGRKLRLRALIDAPIS